MLDGQGVESLIGRSFHGYRVKRFIARGGMSMVFEGLQESLDRPVAIKILYPHLSDDERFRERFEREARAAARLNHPSIVRTLDFGSDGPVHYIVQDFIDGESLRERLARVHADGLILRTETVLSMLQQVGSALSYAHGLGYVHRDVKPGNILINREGKAFLADFGLVKVLGSNQATGVGVIIGTPEYMAPEQSSGATSIGPAADQYALAIVAYEMLVGRVPFQAPTPLAVMRMQMSDPPPPPTSLVPFFSPGIEDVLTRALAKQPEDRFETVDEFVGQLASAATYAVSPPPVAATPAPSDGSQNVSSVGSAPTLTGATPTPAPAVIESSSKTGRSFPFLPLAGAAGALVIVALAAFFLLSMGDGNGGSNPTPTTGLAGAGGLDPVTGSPTAPIQSIPSSANTPTQAVAQSTPTAAIAETVASPPVVATPTDRHLAIVFSAHRGDVHDSQIYIMNADGSGQRQLTSARGHSWGPRVSPDGRRFFFSSVAPGEHTTHSVTGGGLVGSGNHDIYVAELRGTDISDFMPVNITNITSGITSWDNGWAWSPDGEWITYTTDRDGNWEIYRMNVSGGNATRLTNHPADDGWPSWTPDGRQIVFSSNRDGNWELYVMNADGSEVRRLTTRPETQDLFPSVSPDGTKVAFSSQVATVNEGEIYLINLDGSEPVRLTNTAALNNNPSWCSDGSKIVFESDRDGNENIYIMDADGSNSLRLTNDAGEDTTPSCQYIRRTVS